MVALLPEEAPTPDSGTARHLARCLVWCPAVLPLGLSSLGLSSLGLSPLGFLPLGFLLHQPPFLVATSLKACHHLPQMDGQRTRHVKQDVQMVRHQLAGYNGYLWVVVRNAVHLLQHRSAQIRRKEPRAIGGYCRLAGITHQRPQEGAPPLYRQRQHIDSRLAIVPVVQSPFIGWYRLLFLHASAKIQHL